MTKRELILVLLVAVFSISAFVFTREKSHSLFSNEPAFSLEDIESMKQHFMDSFRYIRGTIQNIATHEDGTRVFSVVTEIPDVMRDNFFEQKVPQMTRKTISLAITPQTIIEGPSEFKNGDIVNVSLDRGVYDGEVFDVLKISLNDRELEFKRLAGYSDSIGGTIKSVGKNFFTISTEVTDLTKLEQMTPDSSGSFIAPRIKKEYKVFFDGNTKLSNLHISDLKPGKNVIAWDDENILGKSSFTAVRIRIEK